ncbi:sensor histidine kinase [Methylobacterium organophilum]|uniref:histidine kinase n=1 Tax=Methylobacterium organophilum TaxID=410 RepID=A0ABQ4T8W0_METOR|nr:HAMP domain-containing sensor histidine kinase [Methylobacterium organophilum]GJE27683.1 Adaptive-response sensory-kinase SasA [Methylobacterium organophilum]
MNPPAPSRAWLPSRLRPFGGSGSLQRRLLLAAGAFLGIALVAAGLSIGFILHRFVRGQVDGRLDDRLLSLVSDLRPAAEGGLSLGRDRDGPPFDRPRSGWYWQVRRGEAVLRSDSLESRALAVPALPAERLEDDAPVSADGIGPWGDSLILRVLAVPGQGGAPPTVYAASAPAAALRGPVLEALRTLAVCLGLIGLFLFAGVVFQIRLGLRPLHRLRDQLAAVRAGGLDRLPGPQPAEVRPLVAEMNALLAQNAANLEHARAHVANLAHGLKTPLATLAMALAETGSERDLGLARHVEGMDRRIRHHLRRARAAAIAGPSRIRADLAAQVADLSMALVRLHADKDIDVVTAVPDGLTVACDPQDLDEMLGNLTENACKWCRGRVRIRAARQGGAVVVRVEDDGPGLDEAARAEAMMRGRRLDESRPGHGFGLPIAMELAELYGGSVALAASEFGGLEARLTLPA